VLVTHTSGSTAIRQLPCGGADLSTICDCDLAIVAVVNKNGECDFAADVMVCLRCESKRLRFAVNLEVSELASAAMCPCVLANKHLRDYVDEAPSRSVRLITPRTVMWCRKLCARNANMRQSGLVTGVRALNHRRHSSKVTTWNHDITESQVSARVTFNQA